MTVEEITETVRTRTKDMAFFTTETKDTTPEVATDVKIKAKTMADVT
jgi:hypothetical protein